MTSKFQIITLAIFIICIIAGVAAFALYRGNSQSNSLPAITIWGTFPADIFNQHVSTVNNNEAQSITVIYVQKNPDTFSRDFVNALAIGQGPDAILVSADLILPQMNKITFIPYTILSKRDFMDSYIQEANIYLSDKGIVAIPFTIDPLVMYWNRDIYNSASVATYPRYWDEFTGTTVKPGLVQKMITKDNNSNIRKTAIAMGDFSNITNAREVLGSLMLQSGNPITVAQIDGSALSAIGAYSSASTIPALKFFTQFIDPTNANYSWNRGMVNDKTAFLSGTLSTYFGFASELSNIRTKNANINFDVASLPQLRSGGVKAVYGKIYGFSLVRASANADAAYKTISLLTSPIYISDLAKSMYLPTVRVDIISQGSDDPYIAIFNQAALISKTWLDADPVASRGVFGTLVQSVTSGKKTFDQGVQDASSQYNLVLKQTGQ
ncbi:MAG: extracellular solute-binding protein [Candidatus Paceibacterota bacterium]|jgi:ABC-type glycerol-3-phosphate transport system substrate-binding protein